VSQKQEKLFLSGLCYISINFDNFATNMTKTVKLCQVLSFPITPNASQRILAS